MMTPKQALKYMRETGRCVKSKDRTSHYFYKYFRNDVILQMLPAVSCAADGVMSFSPEHFVQRSKYYQFVRYVVKPRPF